MKAKFAEWSKDKGLIKLAIGFASAILILIICLCISIGMRSNIHKKYSTTMELMQRQVYENLTTMTELFSYIDDPTVDVRYKLIPELKAQYATASAVNSMLAANGNRYAVLDEAQIAAFDAAFEQYFTAYRQGTPTGLAKADLQVCIEDIQPMVTAYNTPETNPEDEVVVINASSGKIEEPETAGD